MQSAKLDFSVDELTDEHKKEMEKHAGFNQETIVGHYNEVCTNYEAIYLRVGFHDPKKCQELASECYQVVGKEKADIDVLDMGCGTGLVGQYLHEDGFKNIVGLDASPGMLKEAE
jgi:2-polyprenyl-3-methyl-5-hydroxy-6-metoxy-1,4-benzoquinol methylase